MKARPLSFYIWLHYIIMLVPAVALIGLAVYLEMWWLVSASLVFLGVVAVVKLKLMWDLQREVSNIDRQADDAALGRPIEPLDTAFLEINKLSLAFVDTQRRREVIVNELRHRGRNTLAKVQALIVLAIRKSPSTALAADRVFELIAVLKRQDDLLVGHDLRGASLREVLGQELEHVRTLGNVELMGPDVALYRTLAEDLGLVVHELATNAAKYGALRAANGKVSVRWSYDAPVCKLDWIELGGPPVPAGRTAGFGTMLTDSMLKKHGGRVDRTFATTGLMLHMSFSCEKPQ